MTNDQPINLATVRAGWEELRQLRLETTIAERFAVALEQYALQMACAAAVAAGVLKEMHPGLKGHLPFANQSPGPPDIIAIDLAPTHSASGLS